MSAPDPGTSSVTARSRPNEAERQNGERRPRQRLGRLASRFIIGIIAVTIVWAWLSR